MSNNSHSFLSYYSYCKLQSILHIGKKKAEIFLPFSQLLPISEYSFAFCEDNAKQIFQIYLKNVWLIYKCKTLSFIS